jgi:hypothetical protein
MTGEPGQDPSGAKEWRSAPELPCDIFDALRKPGRAISPVAIVATVDEDGAPRTAPFGSLRAVSPKVLRVACGNYLSTCKNLRRDGEVSVAVLAPVDIAVSIRGRARVVKEQMEIARHLVLFEIDIHEVKNDMMRHGKIESCVDFTPPDDLKPFYVGAIAEMEDM